MKHQQRIRHGKVTYTQTDLSPAPRIAHQKEEIECHHVCQSNQHVKRPPGRDVEHARDDTKCSNDEQERDHHFDDENGCHQEGIENSDESVGGSNLEAAETRDISGTKERQEAERELDIRK